MKTIKISPDLDKTHRYTFQQKDTLSKQIESVQQQVQEIHAATVYKYTRTSPFRLSKEILSRMHLEIIYNPQYNQQWMELKGEKVGPLIITSLS